MDQLKSSLFSVLGRAGGSTTLRKLLMEYENLTGRKLPYRELGYGTPFSLVADLTDIVKITNGRISLINSSVKLLTQKDRLKTNEQTSSDYKKNDPSHRDTDGRLARPFPGIVREADFLSLIQCPSFVEQWFSDDECAPAYKFPSPEVPREWVTVEIVDAYSPSEFWVRTRECTAKFLKLMKKLNDYYKDLPTETDDDRVPHELPILFIPELAVCAYYADEWTRAVLKSIDCQTGKLELFCVDYGSTIQVNPSNVKTLHRMFANEAMLAIKASLANVRPPDGEWSMESYSFMYIEWGYMRVSAKIVKVHHEVPLIEVFLFSDKKSKHRNNFTRWTNEARDLVWNVNKLLVECKYAVWIETPQPEELSRDSENAKLFQESEPPEEEELPEEKELPEEEKQEITDEQGTSHFGETPPGPAFVEDRLFKSSAIAGSSSDCVKCYPEEKNEVIVQHIPAVTCKEGSENPAVYLTGLGLTNAIDANKVHSGVRVEQQQSSVAGGKPTTTVIDVLSTDWLAAPSASSFAQHDNSFSNPGQSLQIPKDSRLEDLQENQASEGTLNQQHEVETTKISYRFVNFSTHKSTSNLLLFKLNEQYLVSKDALIELTKVEPVYASCRCKVNNLEFLEIQVNKHRSPEVWDLLQSLMHIDGDKKDYVLVRLQDAATICKAVDPGGRSHYEEPFKRLIEQLQELSLE